MKESDVEIGKQGFGLGLELGLGHTGSNEGVRRIKPYK